MAFGAELISRIEGVLAGGESVDRARPGARPPVPLTAAALLSLFADSAAAAAAAATAAVGAVLLVPVERHPHELGHVVLRGPPRLLTVVVVVACRPSPPARQIGRSYGPGTYRVERQVSNYVALT